MPEGSTCCCRRHSLQHTRSLIPATSLAIRNVSRGSVRARRIPCWHRNHSSSGALLPLQGVAPPVLRVLAPTQVLGPHAPRVRLPWSIFGTLTALATSVTAASTVVLDRVVNHTTAHLWLHQPDDHGPMVHTYSASTPPMWLGQQPSTMAQQLPQAF
jgi:hypothetical protein